MAIIYSYPKKNNPQGSDVFIITDPSATSKNKNRTKSVDLDAISTYVITSQSAITGLGSAESIPVFTGPTTLGNSNIIDDGVEVIVGVDFRVDGSNTDIESAKLNMINGGIDLLEATVQSRGITFTHPAGGASANVNLYFAGAGAGSRFVISRGATGGPEIELEASGNVNINRTGNGNFFVGGEVTLDDYGSGAITGTPTFNLQVDANGKIIETTGGPLSGSGTLNTVPLFTPDGTTLGDSIITQGALGQGIIVDGQADVNDDLNVTGSIETSANIVIAGDATFQSTITAGGGTGTAGQVLSSTGTGVAWVNSGGGTDVKQLDITVTPAQLLSLNGGNTIQLLAAPGAQKMYYIVNGLINLKFNSIVYDFSAGGISDVVTVQLGTVSLFGDTALNTANLNSASDTYFIGDPISPSGQVPVNVPINLTSTSGISVSQGNSDLNFSLLYREIDLSF